MRLELDEEKDTDMIYRQVGLIYKAAMDDAFFKAFHDNAAVYLAAAGVKQSFLDKRAVTAVKDTKEVLHVIIPDDVKDKAYEKFEEYLQELGFVTIMGCK
jgi:hypothetical protein